MRCCSINARDVLILKKITQYCQRIEDNLARYDCSLQAFEEDAMFQDACCMCVVQIGELASQLSDEAKAIDPAVPWRDIKDTRNFYVHNYGSVDVPMVWDTITTDIPMLKKACEQMLSEKA